jgi:hypothetical protein
VRPKQFVLALLLIYVLRVAAVNIVAIGMYPEFVSWTIDDPAMTVYGVPRTDKDSVYLAQRMRKMMNEITYAMVTAKYLVDFFPILKHVPLQFAKWKRDALNWHDRTMELFVSLNRDVEAKMVRPNIAAGIACAHLLSGRWGSNSFLCEAADCRQGAQRVERTGAGLARWRDVVSTLRL